MKVVGEELCFEEQTFTKVNETEHTLKACF